LLGDGDDLYVETQQLQPLRQQLDDAAIAHVELRRRTADRRAGDQRVEHAEQVGERFHRVAFKVILTRKRASGKAHVWPL